MKRIWLAASLGAMLPLLLAGADAQADGRKSEPVWEVGIAGIGFYGADYPASDESSLRGLPAPYAIYRGDFFRVGEDSIVSGVFFENALIEFDVSLDAAFDVDSDENEARRGMPDLGYLFQAGPQLTVKLGDYGGGELDLALPLRIAISTDFTSVRYQGLIFEPQLVYDRDGLFDLPLDLFASVGPTVTQERLQDFIYQVDPEFARPDRPAFDAKAGYLGSDLTIGLSYDISESVSTFVGGQFAYYGGSANSDSPLFNRAFNAGVAVGLSWSFYQSDRRVLR